MLARFELVFNIWLTRIIVFLLNEGAGLRRAVVGLEAVVIWHLECITSTIVRLIANSLQLILNSFQFIILRFLINDDLRVLFFILIFILIFVIVVVLADRRARLRLLFALLLFLSTIIFLLFEEAEAAEYARRPRLFLLKHLGFVFESFVVFLQLADLIFFCE